MNKKRNKTTGGPQSYKYRSGGLSYRDWYRYRRVVWNFQREMRKKERELYGR
jgi:hypothetical protein